MLVLCPEARALKAKIKCWDDIKIKRFCTVMDSIPKTKRQPREWEKIFADDISDNGLVYKYEVLIELNTQNTTLFKKDQKTGAFSQGKHTDGQQAHKKMLNITHCQGNANQNCNRDTTAHPSEWLKSKTQDTSVGQEVEKKEPSWTVGGNANWYSHCGKKYGISSNS